MNELQHHGILGMKWGKRNGPPYPLNESNKSASEIKAQSKQLKKDQKAYDKNVKKNWYKAYNQAADKMNNSDFLEKLNKKYEDDYYNPKYEEEYQEEFGRLYTEAWLEMFGDRPV